MEFANDGSDSLLHVVPNTRSRPVHAIRQPGAALVNTATRPIPARRSIRCRKPGQVPLICDRHPIGGASVLSPGNRSTTPVSHAMEHGASEATRRLRWRASNPARRSIFPASQGSPSRSDPAERVALGNRPDVRGPRARDIAPRPRRTEPLHVGTTSPIAMPSLDARTPPRSGREQCLPRERPGSRRLTKPPQCVDRAGLPTRARRLSRVSNRIVHDCAQLRKARHRSDVVRRVFGTLKRRHQRGCQTCST